MLKCLITVNCERKNKQAKKKHKIKKIVERENILQSLISSVKFSPHLLN